MARAMISFIQFNHPLQLTRAKDRRKNKSPERILPIAGFIKHSKRSADTFDCKWKTLATKLIEDMINSLALHNFKVGVALGCNICVVWASSGPAGSNKGIFYTDWRSRISKLNRCLRIRFYSKVYNALTVGKKLTPYY